MAPNDEQGGAIQFTLPARAQIAPKIFKMSNWSGEVTSPIRVGC